MSSGLYNKLAFTGYAITYNMDRGDKGLRTVYTNGSKIHQYVNQNLIREVPEDFPSAREFALAWARSGDQPLKVEDPEGNLLWSREWEHANWPYK